MLKDAKNKQITDASNKTDAPLEEFHFAGGGEYEPITIQAKDREEAEKIWYTKRTKVEQNPKVENTNQE